MPYPTFDEVADRLDGVARLRSLLNGHEEDLAAETEADEHPYFDEQRDLADREVNTYLARAGIALPLSEPIDPLLRKAKMALLIDRLTEVSSSRESVIDTYAAKWRAWLKSVADGEVEILGATLADDGGDLALASSIFTEVPQFDLGDPYATVNQVFPSLGNPNRR